MTNVLQRLRPFTLLRILLLSFLFISSCTSQVTPEPPKANTPNPTNTPDLSFDYKIRVFDDSTGNALQDAKITLELETVAPLTRFTDATGVARFFIDNYLASRPAVLTIEKAGYQRYPLNVDLYKNRLPGQVRLTPLSNTETGSAEVPPTQTPTPLFTLTSTSSPIPITPTWTPLPTTTPTFTPSPSPSPSPTSTIIADSNTATAVLQSSIFAEPNAESEELAYLEPGDEITVIAITANGSWLLVCDDHNQEGFVASSRVEFSGNPPTVTPSPTPWTSPTPAVVATFAPLTIDFWELSNTGRCVNDEWHKRMYIRGLGGDLNYTYSFFYDVDRQVQSLADRHDDSFTFEIMGTGTTAIRLTGEVHSGDGQMAQRTITVQPYPCP